MQTQLQKTKIFFPPLIYVNIKSGVQFCLTWGFSFQLFQFNFSRIFTTWHFELEKFELRHKKKIKIWSFETSDAILSFRFDVSNTVWIRLKPVVENRPKVVELFLTLLLICQTCDPRGHVIPTTTGNSKKIVTTYTGLPFSLQCISTAEIFLSSTKCSKEDQNKYQINFSISLNVPLT